MLKCSGNSLLVLGILLCNNVFFKTEGMAQQTNLNNVTHLPAQYSQQVNTANGSVAVIGQPIDLKSINPTDTVAVVTGDGKSEPNVFKTDKKIFPSAFTGWVYIMSGADYLEYIKDDSTPQRQQNFVTQLRQNAENYNLRTDNNHPNFNAQQNSRQSINNARQNARNKQGITIQQPTVNQQPMGPQQSTVAYQQPGIQKLETGQQLYYAQQQPTIQQQFVTPQQTVVNQQNGLTQTNTTPQIVDNTVSNSAKIDQGKPDNETPEVLIHDGAVYTLANSVEVTNAGNGNTVQTAANVAPQSGNSQVVQSQQLISPLTGKQTDGNSLSTQLYTNNGFVNPNNNETIPVNGNNVLNTQNNGQPINGNIPLQNNVYNNVVASDNQQPINPQQNFQNQNNWNSNNQSTTNQNNHVQQQY